MHGLTEPEVQQVLDFFDERVAHYAANREEREVVIDLLGTVEFAAVVDTASNGIEVEGTPLCKKVSTRTVSKLVADRKVTSARG